MTQLYIAGLVLNGIRFAPPDPLDRRCEKQKKKMKGGVFIGVDNVAPTDLLTLWTNISLDPLREQAVGERAKLERTLLCPLLKAVVDVTHRVSSPGNCIRCLWATAISIMECKHSVHLRTRRKIIRQCFAASVVDRYSHSYQSLLYLSVYLLPV